MEHIAGMVNLRKMLIIIHRKLVALVKKNIKGNITLIVTEFLALKSFVTKELHG